MNRRRTVLVVEDHDGTRWTLDKLFRHSDWDCEAAPTVDDALAILDYRSGEFPVAVVDLMMPGRSGVEFITEVRRRGLPMRLVVYTASYADLVEQARDAGADAITYKRCGFAELLAAVEARSEPSYEMDVVTVGG